MVTQVDPERGTKEIYTSMKDMEAFFMEELEFVEDLQALLDKKLVSQEAKVRVQAGMVDNH